MQTKLQTFEERHPSPTPPSHHIKYSGHHWLDQYDFDNRYCGTFVWQWCPSEKKWCHSGEAATGSSVFLHGWVYNSPCIPPEPVVGQSESDRPKKLSKNGGRG